jgi:transmembrane sensor
METKRLNYLLNRYYKGICTAEEEQELDSWYQSLNINDQQFESLVRSAGGQEQLAEDLYAGFRARMEPEAPVRRLNPRKWMLRAAAVLTGFCLLAGGYYLYNRTPEHLAAVVPAKPNENRFITLADGSKVVLRAGSRLIYPSSFTGNKREVELIGEAYFDIYHNAKKPFIIHTGNIKTTVLGTAFDIDADPSKKKVVVTVTRGRVKVEDDHKISVILTPNEQVVCDKKTDVVQKNKVEAVKTLVWAGSDMDFDGVAFKNIASLLSRRYQVSINFKNPALEDCPITASFTGTETLKDILEILCTARGTTYKFDNAQKVTIDGIGCNVIN